MRAARMMAVGTVGLSLLAGCSAWPFRTSATMLAEADRHLAEGRWDRALTAYDEILRADPDGAAGARARSGRQTTTAAVAAATEVARLRELTASLESELQRLRQSATVREGELVRIRQELTARQVEAERLRADLEQLKRIDLRERRPR